MEKIVNNGVNCYEKQTNTKRYDEYKMTDHFWCFDSQYKIAGEMRVICDSILQK